MWLEREELEYLRIVLKIIIYVNKFIIFKERCFSRVVDYSGKKC